MTKSTQRVPEIGWNDIVCIVDRQVSSRLGEEVVILELDRGIYYSLNQTGAFIWDQLLEPVGVATLHQRLAAEFDVEAQTARDDLIRLLNRLREAGLIESRRASGS